MKQHFVHKKISSIQFGLFSPAHVKKMAAAKIVTPELYDREGYPVDGGLMDLRLGVIDPGLVCKTDGLKLKESLGHFGYIELARPVIHINFVRQSYKNKLFLYFHNDPLSMNGSKNTSERLSLLNNVDRLIFNSEWSRKRFFVNINNDKLFQKTNICYQSAPKTKIDFNKYDFMLFLLYLF